MQEFSFEYVEFERFWSMMSRQLSCMSMEFRGKIWATEISLRVISVWMVLKPWEWMRPLEGECRLRPVGTINIKSQVGDEEMAKET